MADYNDLLTQIPIFAENATSELAAALPTLVGFAEDRLNREIQVVALEAISSSALTAGSQFITRPTDLFALRQLMIQANNAWQPLLQKQLGVLQIFYPSLSAQGTPRFYAVYDATRYAVFTNPDANYPYQLSYRKRLANLTVGSPTNWFTDNAYDALLAATMVEVGRFVLDDRQQSLIAMWEPRYQSALQSLNAIARADSVNDYALPFKAAPPEGGQMQG